MTRVDVFISHASEDKRDVARPLAALLVQAGLTVWLDEAELVLGDSLRRKIDQGLASARHGVVVLSKAFFSKEWPQKELDALVAREDGTQTVILPVWHNITAREIATFSPMLADRLGTRTDKGLPSVVAAILRAVRHHASGDPSISKPDTQATASNPLKLSGPKRIDQLVVEFIDRVAEIHEADQEITGVRTGFHDLDRLIDGLTPGELYVLASRPSVGSTTFALNVAQHVASAEGLPVLYFSPHARVQELLNRLIAATGRIDRWHLASGRLTADEWERLSEAVELVHKGPLYIDDAAPLTISEVSTRSVRVRDEAGAVALIVIDTFEMLSQQDGQQVPSTEIRHLRLLARQINCPVLVLTTIPRNSETRIDKRPLLSDLPSHQVVEQNALAVLLLYRDDYYDRDSTDSGSIEVIVAQNRGRVAGTIKLAFTKASGRMDNLAYPSD